MFRRRQVWLPTWWGALWLLLLALAGFAALAHAAYGLLAPQQPARGPAGEGARTLVVEGWLDQPQLQQAVAAFRQGGYLRVFTTGGPVDAWLDADGRGTYAQRAAVYLRTHGLADVPVIAVPTPDTAVDRTWLSAVTLRDWAAQNGIRLQGIDLFTAGVHARRSWLVYRMAFGDAAAVGVLAAQPSDYDPQRWWGTSAGAKSVLGEALSVGWTYCCFWPAADATPRSPQP